MNLVSYIPLKSALVDLYDLIDEDDMEVSEPTLIEWSAKAMRNITVRQSYDYQVAFLTVSNHKAKLPCGLLYIDFIAYKDTLEEADIQQIRLYTSTAESNTITHKYLDFLQAPYFTESWKMLRLAETNAFLMGIHCKNPINLYMKCEHEYSVDKQGYIHTSFKDGYLAISYFSYPMQDGDFLIPNDEDVKEAIKNFCLMRLWEKRMNLKEEQAANMYTLYRKLYTISSKNAEGKLLKPQGPDGYENLKQQLLRIGQHTHQYYSAFGNLNAGETIDFNSPRGYR